MAEKTPMIHRVYNRLGARSRRKRLQRLYPLLTNGAETRVLDVGGTTEFWLKTRVQARVTVVNLDPLGEGESALPSWLDFQVADGLNLPFSNKSFDVVFSNSVIEHLATWDSQEAFAREVQRVGSAYFVQTPSRAFPIEPHYLTPFIHWLPKPLRLRLVGRFTVWAWITHPSQEYAEGLVQEIRLLTRKELLALFPSADVVIERFWFLPKSLLAICPSKGVK